MHADDTTSMASIVMQASRLKQQLEHCPESVPSSICAVLRSGATSVAMRNGYPSAKAVSMPLPKGSSHSRRFGSASALFG